MAEHPWRRRRLWVKAEEKGFEKGEQSYWDVAKGFFGYGGGNEKEGPLPAFWSGGRDPGGRGGGGRGRGEADG